MALAALVDDVLGGGLPIAVEAYDGSRSGPVDAPATIVIRSPDALRRIVTAPGEQGLARATAPPGLPHSAGTPRSAPKAR